MKLTTILNYKQQGFSLIELLLIIFIFGLLAILLIPGLIANKNQAQEEENKQQILHKLHTIKLGLELFHYKSGYYPVYNFPLSNQSITQMGTLQELLNHYSKLSEFIKEKITHPERYYYYAPANTKLSTITPFYPSQRELNKAPLTGAQKFIIIYDGQQQYYTINSYNSNLLSITKKDSTAAQQKQLKKLLKF